MCKYAVPDARAQLGVSPAFASSDVGASGSCGCIQCLERMPGWLFDLAFLKGWPVDAQACIMETLCACLTTQPHEHPMTSSPTTDRSVLGTAHAQIAFQVPPGACDCHVHVFGPASRYPFSMSRVYTPPDAPIEALVRLQGVLGFERLVVVHPSPYGSDNACSLDAVARLGARARMVAVIDHANTDDELAAMHDAGVRGARLNLETTGVRDPSVARALLIETAERIAPFGWHLQTFTNLAVLEALENAIVRLPVPLVVDHIGHCRADKGLAQPGMDALLRLVESRNVFVKLSGAYRVSALPDYADVDDIARALIAAGPDRMVWGSDWPHVGGTRDPNARDRVQPFLPIDDGVQLNALARWAPDPGLRKMILADTPALLYDFR